MEPVTLTIGVGAFAVIGAVGSILTIYYKLKSSVESQVQDVIQKEVKDSESKIELRIVTLEIELKNLDNSTVKRDELAGLRSDLRAVMQRLEDMIRRFESLEHKNI